MKRLFEALPLNFETPNWARSPAFGLLDIILEQQPEFIVMMKDDVPGARPVISDGKIRPV
jgi:hypothetical protein